MSDFDAAQPLSARDFVAQQLRANPDLTFAEIRERARAAGVSVAPFLYGAARRDLGLPPKVDNSSSSNSSSSSSGANASMRSRAAAAATDRDDDAPLDLGAAEAELAGDLDEGSHEAPVQIPRRSAPAVPPTPAVSPAVPQAEGQISMAMAGQTRSRSPKADEGHGAQIRQEQGRQEQGRQEQDRGTSSPADHAADDHPADEHSGASATGAPKGSGFQFAVDALRLSPDILYQDLKARAQMAGLAVPPIVYGRAKAYLGLVPTKPRKPKIDVETAPRSLKQVDSASFAQLPKVGPMPSGITSGLRQIEQLVANVRELEAENRHLRNALQAALSIALAAVEDAEDE